MEESKDNFKKLEIEYNKLKTHITQDNTTEPDYTQIKELNNKIKSNLNSEIIKQETGVSTTFDLEE
ncbi:hypothetical protein ['Camptotheca acuminata' phytoplasma]|uniref:hypothetical protein n=1 Tax='Camptotheca acuminata' phytoplasma TaxID=3239192 RepID=UPI003519DFD4